MPVPQDGAALIEGRVAHKSSNALRIVFAGGPGESLATGIQGAGDGLAAKTAVLFGFKNGGTGKHRLTYGNGDIVWVESKSRQPTEITRGDGSPVAKIERGETSTALGPDGATLLSFVPDPADARTPDLFRILLRTANEQELGRLDVVRRAAGWSIADELWNTYIWWDHAGEPLPVPLLGTRLMLHTEPDPIVRDILLAACVDITLGLRPYISAMN
ncbi:hypothetical protein [Nocardia sp. BMG111209]|uniref:hypothetical protein n=1 Tax=Nocardia sp. BMG111209 TaxID=1160137 RepID=UPI0003607692|nr:hypothetical protein [Nocardia sp. BMG111209]